ncbi:unnamed protein product, partial [Mesorhabditis belari]|uniref:Uncharacterized protein n=1 Tax=Mesorhabditis belari TaxID=2138241 RepID=A0AAF3FCH2_9BILA
MTGRGRGRGSAGASKMKMPNLSMAGKLESKTEQNGTHAGLPGHGPGSRRRGARGFMRGGRGGRDDGSYKGQQIIHSEGIFSGGIGTLEKGSRRSEPGSLTIKEEAVALAQSEAVLPPSGTEKVSIESYDQFWAIDQAEEDTEMNEIMGASIIADLKKGRIPPVVLPRHEELQFFDLLPKQIKEEVFTDGEKVEEIMKEREKERIRQTKSYQDQVEIDDDDSDPTFTYGQKAAQVLRRLAQVGENNDFILIQLPTILGDLSSRVKAGEAVVKQELDIAQSASEIVAGPSTVDSPVIAEPASLPRGKEIGTMSITRKGRVYFKVDGQKIDITSTAAGTTAEGVLGIEIHNEDVPESSGLFGFNPAQRARMNAERGQNALYYFGEIQHHMTASVNWKEMRQSSKGFDVYMKKEDDEQPIPNIYKKPLRSSSEYKAELETLQGEGRKMINELKGVLKNKRPH